MSKERFKKAKRIKTPQVALPMLLIMLLAVGWTAQWMGGLTAKPTAKSLTLSAPLQTPSQPSKEYFYAGGRLIATEAPVIALLAPTSLSALAVTNLPLPKVTVTWNAVNNAAYYQVERATDKNGPFTLVGSNVNQPTMADTSVSPVVAYLYRVRAFDVEGNPSPYSAADLATAISFEDDSLVSQFTPFKAAHINQLRQSVDSIRAMAHLSAFDWGGNLTQFSTDIQATHIQDLRVALDQALSALGLPACSYTDNSLTALRSSFLKKEHIEQLRQCIK